MYFKKYVCLIKKCKRSQSIVRRCFARQIDRHRVDIPFPNGNFIFLLYLSRPRSFVLTVRRSVCLAVRLSICPPTTHLPADLLRHYLVPLSKSLFVCPDLSYWLKYSVDWMVWPCWDYWAFILFIFTIMPGDSTSTHLYESRTCYRKQ